MTKKAIHWITRILITIHVFLFLFLPWQVLAVTGGIQSYVEDKHNVSCGHYFSTVITYCLCLASIELILLLFIKKHKLLDTRDVDK